VTRVLVAAASPVLRAGLEALLGATPSLTVIGESPGALTLTERIEELRPDAVLMAVEAPGDSALEMLPAGLGGAPPTVVLVAEDARGAWVPDLLRAGVRAILPSTAAAGEIVAAVEAAAAGLVALHPEFVDSAIRSATGGFSTPAEPPGQPLTPREVEILTMVSRGLGNKEIAWGLGISDHTVKFHISSIFTKLAVSSRTEAVTLGIRLGLIFI
jgi:NarL family two-component system response regulator YdfI